MTTIAYRNGVLAADSRVSYGAYCYPGRNRKIRAVYDGNEKVFVAASGTIHLFNAFMDYAIKNKKIDGYELPYGVTILVLRRSGLFIMCGKESEFAFVDQDFYAIGSGADFAVGAMAMGASAKRAVELACLYDTGTAGPICTVKLKVRSK